MKSQMSGAMSRPRTSAASFQEMMKRRSQSNKAGSRRNIATAKGTQEHEEVEMHYEEEEGFDMMPHTSQSKRLKRSIVKGDQESTDEILRSHFLLAKMTGKTAAATLPRPQTTAVG